MLLRVCANGARRTDMVELSKERIEQILHEETAKKEELETILRSI